MGNFELASEPDGFPRLSRSQNGTNIRLRASPQISSASNQSSDLTSGIPGLAEENHLCHPGYLTIRRALMTKRERIFEGAYDSYPGEVKWVGSITFELAGQFGCILAEIGTLRETS